MADPSLRAAVALYLAKERSSISGLSAQSADATIVPYRPIYGNEPQAEVATGESYISNLIAQSADTTIVPYRSIYGNEPQAEVATRSPMYTASHGDFCFGYIPSIRLGQGPHDILKTKWYWSRRNEERMLMDTNGFERRGVFPFFKLPGEIRLMILRLILCPLFRYEFQSDEPGSGYISMHLFDPTSVDLSIYGYDVPIGRSLDHPDHSFKYSLSCIPPYEFDKPTDAIFHWLLVDWVRKASYVSRQFRKELEEVIWERMVLQTASGSQSFWDIPLLLEERPAIASGLESLLLDLDCCDEYYSITDFYYQVQFNKICKTIGETLTLKFFEFTLSCWSEDLSDGAFSPTGKFAFLAAAKNLTVTVEFAVQLLIMDVDDEEEHDEMAWKYSPGITQWIMPEYFRASSKNPKQVDDYLASRFGRQVEELI